MIDLAHLEQYRENNRIEAKKALGGLPRSIWETYSAFANTMGGIILLGVEELADKSLHPLGLPDPERLVKEFWDTVNNTTKVSVNILSRGSVTIEQAGSGRIIVISVPRAQRADRPVYLEENPLSGTYRRNGEGDYRCTQEEVRAMLRDAAVRTPDMTVLSETALDVIDLDTLRRYRTRMQSCRPGHVWEGDSDTDFLYKIGAVGRDAGGKLHPTAAGLLMFGHEYEIVREFPYYFLDYQEQMSPGERWTDRMISSSGEWSGNLYDFYFRVYNRIAQDIPTPFRTQNGSRIDDTPVHEALREALANCLVNADYYGRQGVVIIKRPDSISFSNPGDFRIDLNAARSGGVSDPRNGSLIKMLNLINIGERAGSGIPSIYSIWNAYGWPPPIITEQFQPDRITLSLSFTAMNDNISDKRRESATNASASDNTNDKTGDSPSVSTGKTAIHKAAMVEYLTSHAQATSAELAALLGISVSRTRQMLGQLVKDEIVVPQGGNRNRRYRLKR